jgi:ankyrin repeat protein
LLDRGCAINARESESGATPLMLAASLGRTAAVALLLERGADPLLKDNAGRTALSRAYENQNADLVKLLEAARQKPAARTQVS